MNDTFNPLDWIEPEHKPENSDQSQCSDAHAPGPMPPASSQSFPPKRINNPSVPHSSKIPQSFSSSIPQSINPSVHQSLSSEVDTVISRIESSLTDITTSYPDWLNVGFALANEFGEAGRGFFHRVSRFYSGYTKADCDKQFDQCLKSTPSSRCITIKTFFHMAQQAGIEISVQSQWSESLPHAPSQCPNPSIPQSFGSLVSDQSQWSEPVAPSSSEEDPAPEPQPTLPDFIFDQLPDYFQRVVSRADSMEERDILFLGSLVALGSCLTTFSGSYDGNTVYPNLFLYIAARASSGKGRLSMCRNLVNPIHWEKRNQSEKENLVYDMEMREYNLRKGKDLSAEKPERPPVRLHFIPANNSTAGFLQLIGDNDGQGLILETEGDTIAQALKTDYGNFSDALRKGFHHEVISCYRKTDRMHTTIEHPRFSMILSSTIGQLKNLIPSTENGLSSRFIFYYMNLRPVWKDVFAHSGDKSLEEHFDELGQEFYAFYKTLRSTDPIQFSLTEEQKEAFNIFFTQLQDKYLVLQGLDYLAIVRRLGLIAFRIMMILTAMRIPETGDYSTRQPCCEEDFQSTLAIIKTMVRHASYIVSQLPEEAKTEKRGNKKERFFEGLPERFSRKEYVELAKSLGITDRTSDNYMVAFCTKGLVLREQNNSYIKIVTS